MPIVEITGLNKSFNQQPAIKNITLSIERRELFGLIGPDGAGKTTLLRLLTGILTAESGIIKCCGTEITDSAEIIKKNIGVVPQNFSLYEDLTVEENIHFFASMYGVKDRVLNERKEKLLEIMKLTPFVKRRADALSGGMQKKLSIICSLLHTPELLLLDEPTTGIDPISRRELWEFFYELIDHGTTIIVSTPYMDEVERCSRISFLYKGELLICDTPLRIQNNYPYYVSVLSGPDCARLKCSDLAQALPLIDLYPVGDTLHLITKKPALKALKKLFEQKSLEIKSKIMPPDFEDIFTTIIKQKNEEH